MNSLATSSHDSSIKIWDTVTMHLEKNLVGQEGVIYAMSWSADGMYLASCSINGSVFIWDIETSQVKKQLTHHKKACYCIDWCQTVNRNVGDIDWLLSSGGDCSVCVFDDSGDLYKRYWLPSELFGCQWNEHNPNIFSQAKCQKERV